MLVGIGPQISIHISINILLLRTVLWFVFKLYKSFTPLNLGDMDEAQ